MANYIKIPMSSNPGRAMVVGADSLLTSITQSQAGLLTNQTAAATAFTTDGDGTSGVVEMTIAGNSVTVLSTTTGGGGYKVGDTLTFAMAATAGGTLDVIVTLVAGDLSSSFEGSATNPYQMVPVDNVAFVKPVSATKAQIWLNEWDASGGKPYLFDVDMSTGPASTEAQLAADLAEAVHIASSSENEQPEVEFYNNATVLDVDLTSA